MKPLMRRGSWSNPYKTGVRRSRQVDQFYGPIRFDDNSQNLMPYLITQVQPPTASKPLATEDVVAPLSRACFM